jgi:hypothetical protein
LLSLTGQEIDIFIYIIYQDNNQLKMQSFTTEIKELNITYDLIGTKLVKCEPTKTPLLGIEPRSRESCRTEFGL